MSVTAETAARSVGNHVFISYSKADRAFAENVCVTLESAGVKCWMAPRDILPGVMWGEAIIDAIVTSRLMILVFSRASNKSQQVAREVERAASRGVPLLPLRIEDVPLSKSLELYLSTSQWLDAFTPPREQHLDRLVASVRKLVGATSSEPIRRSSQRELRQDSAPQPSKPASRAKPKLIAAAGVVGAIVAIAGSVWALNSVFSGDKSPPPATGTPVLAIVGPKFIDRKVGDRFTLRANVDGKPAPASSAVLWRSSDTAVARVIRSTDGLTMAVAPGVAALFAEASGTRDSVFLTVHATASVTPRPPTLATLRLAPPPQMRVGDSLLLAVTATDSAGQRLAVARVSWRSSSPSVAAVDSARGVLRAVAPGRTTITARVGSTSAIAVATIVARPVTTRPPAQRLSDSIVRPTPPVSSPLASPVTPPLTSAISRALAEECMGALRQRDRAWLSAHYVPEKAVDQNNFRALSDLVGRRDYAVQEIALNTGDPLTDFQLRLSYANAFGRRRTVDAVFTVGAVWFNGQWMVKSCRIKGTLLLP